MDKGILTFLKESDSKNTPSPSSSTVFGISISISDWQPPKAWDPIFLTDGGMIISFND